MHDIGTRQVGNEQSACWRFQGSVSVACIVVGSWGHVWGGGQSHFIALALGKHACR